MAHPSHSIILEYANVDQLIAWDDERRVQEYTEHLDRLEGDLALLAGANTPQAKFAREYLGAEYTRASEVLASRSSVDAERAALVAARDALLAHRARPPATTVEDETTRPAIERMLARALDAARVAMIAACKRRQLPSLKWAPISVRAKASSNTFELAAVSDAIRKYEFGIGNIAVRHAEMDGRSVNEGDHAMAAYLAVAEHAREYTPEARLCFAIRASIVGKRSGAYTAPMPSLRGAA